MAKTTTALTGIYRTWDATNSTWQAYYFRTAADLVAENATKVWFSPTERTKLTGVAAGAQVNVIESVKVNGSALSITSKAVNIDLSSYLTGITKAMVEGVLTGAISSHTHNYAAPGDITALDGRLDTLEAIINSAGSADGDTVINKLNEIFALLENSTEGDNLVTMLAAKVPTTRTVNTKALSSNIVLSGADILVGGSTSANAAALISVAFKTLEDSIAAKVPTTRTVNTKALSGNVVLYGTDIAMTSNDATTIYEYTLDIGSKAVILNNHKSKVWVSATEPVMGPNVDWAVGVHPGDVWIELV